MEPRKGKHILYTICFICFALMDWMRGSLDWKYWTAAINLTGLIMAIIMMSHFHWKQEAKKPYLLWLPIWLVGSVIGYVIWKQDPTSLFPAQYAAAAVSALFIGVVAIRVWRERQQLEDLRKKNLFLLICWIVMSVLMSCSRLGEIWPFWYMVFFGLFYLIPFSENERKSLWNASADGLIAAFFGLQIFAYGFRPYDAVRYSGAYFNCNMNALFYMVTYIALLYRSHSLSWQERCDGVIVTWKRRAVKVMLWVLTAGIWGFVSLTMTRTALLMLILITLVYWVLEYGIIIREKIWKVFGKGILFVAGIVIVFPVVFLTVRYLPTILHHPVWFGTEYSPSKVHSYDPPDSTKYIDFDEVLDSLFNRIVTGSQGEAPEAGIEKMHFPMLASAEITGDMLQSSAIGVLLTDASVENNVQIFEEAIGNSTISRLRIWEMYLKNLNFAGHELEEGYFQITERYHAWHAQNLFLQIAFYYGIIPGILLIVLTMGIGIKALQLVVKKRRCEDILPLLVGLLFVGYGMLESVWYPGQTILLLIYMIPKILIDSRKELQEAGKV